MDDQTEFTDLAKMLDELQDQRGSLQSIWCTPGTSFETIVSYRRSMLLSGAWSPQFISNADGLWEVPFVNTLVRPRIILANEIGPSFVEWLPLLEDAAKHNAPLLFVVRKIGGELLRAILLNNARGTLSACVIKDTDLPVGSETVIGMRHQEPPTRIEQLALVDEAWIRKDASALFLDNPQNDQHVLTELAIMEVGGEDLEDQKLRIRYVSDSIRKRQREHLTTR